MHKAYVLICNESGTEDSVLSNLRLVPSIRTAYGTFGSYDIVSVLESDAESKIRQDISAKIRRIPQIRSTLTLLADKKCQFSKTTREENEVLKRHMTQAFVMVRCHKIYEREVVENLKQIPEVLEIDCLVGSYEVICKVVAPTFNDISDIISKKIRKLDRIKSTVTINIIDNQGFSK